MLLPFALEAVLKDVRFEVRSADQCGLFSEKEEGVLQMQTSALFGAKHFVFSKFIVCPYGERRFESVRTFCGQVGMRSIFAILCGRLLWTAPYSIL